MLVFKNTFRVPAYIDLHTWGVHDWLSCIFKGAQCAPALAAAYFFPPKLMWRKKDFATIIINSSSRNHCPTTEANAFPPNSFAEACLGEAKCFAVFKFQNT